MSRAPRPAAGSRRGAIRRGCFVNASLDKASTDNERLAIRIARPGRGEPEIGFVLIAGLVARRIVCPVYEGQLLGPGERIGIIRFGSRADIYCPPPYLPLVASDSARSPARPCSPTAAPPSRSAAGWRIGIARSGRDRQAPA